MVINSQVDLTLTIFFAESKGTSGFIFCTYSYCLVTEIKFCFLFFVILSFRDHFTGAGVLNPNTYTSHIERFVSPNILKIFKSFKFLNVNLQKNRGMRAACGSHTPWCAPLHFRIMVKKMQI